MTNPLKIFYLFIALLFQVTSFAQLTLTDTSLTKYYSASSAIDTNWNATEFNDSSWSHGDGIIGYGDSTDVDVVLAQTLYIRSYFNVTDLSVEEMSLICDFDDGFVAYINGVECARVNMGRYNSATTFDQLADRSHEMQIIQNTERPVLGYYVDKDFIDTVIHEGQNVLAIEVHNDSINGSDLGFYGGYIYSIDFDSYNMWDEYSRYKKCIELDSTHLPILLIETGEMGIPHRRDANGSWIEVPARMEIKNNTISNWNKPDDVNSEYAGNISIHLRGQSSSDFCKQQYNIELLDDNNNDTSISLMGMPRESDWILQGPFADKSQIRNVLAYELANKTGHWTPRVKFCEVVFNGEYVGLYNLVEKIKRDSNRVNIAKLRKEEIVETDLTGGYIFRFDWDIFGEIQIVYPKEKNIQAEQSEYIHNFYNEYLSVLFSDNWLDPLNGYRKYINETSLIDYMILAELAKNVDAYNFSSYMYKDKDDRDGKIHFGPIWDYDLAFGNASWGGVEVNDWQFIGGWDNSFNLQRLMQDTLIVKAFNNRWFELRNRFLHNDSINDRIDEITTLLTGPIDRNNKVWPVIDKNVFGGVYHENYDKEIDYLKTWIENRAEWIDQNIADISVGSFNNAINSVSKKLSEINVYPNPFKQAFTMNVNIPNAGILDVSLIDIMGRLEPVMPTQHVDSGSFNVDYEHANLKNGLYMLVVKIDGRILYQVKLMKLE